MWPRGGDARHEPHDAQLCRQAPSGPLMVMACQAVRAQSMDSLRPGIPGRGWRLRVPRGGERGMLAALSALLVMALGLPSWGADDADQANRHDAAWREAWVAHACRCWGSPGKIPGFVLQIGDSITHANPYSQWPRSGAASSREDAATCQWLHAQEWNRGSQADATCLNGWYLACADTSRTRGMTASSSITTGEMLSGDGNGGAAMPCIEDEAQARSALADGAAYPANLNIATIAAAFPQAQCAVVMLGTNDSKQGLSAEAYIANLARIIDALEARRILAVLSTIPPHSARAADALSAAYAVQLQRLARARGLPLIDFRAEILARAPEPSCFGTLIGANDPHPTAEGGSYTAASDPYQDGGDARTRACGAAAARVGYLLRSWLTVEKLAQVRAAVVDASPSSAAR